jgi:hypothetical protein
MHEVNTIYKREAIAFTTDNIHFHSSLTIIQRLHPSYMTLEQVAEMKPAYQKQKGMRTLFSRHGLHLRLQATKLFASITYPLKITKVNPPCLSNKSHHLLLVNIRLCVRLSECCRRCGCGWHLKLNYLKLLLEIGDHHCPLLKLEVLLLNLVLEVYDHVRALVQHLTSGV